MSEISKPLVLGASGLTGTEVVRILSEAGLPVRVTFREQWELTKLREFGAETVAADFNDAESLKNAMTGIGRVLMIAPTAPQALEWNLSAINIAKEAGVRHFIRLSGVGANEGVGARIAKAHFEADEALKASGLSWTIIKPAPYYQNMFWSVITIVRNNVFSLPLEAAQVAQVDVHDVARVAAHTLIDDGHEGKTYTITGPQALTMFQVARKISKAIGKEVRYMPAPAGAAKQVFRDVGLPEWDSTAIGEMFTEYATGKYAAVSGDFTAVTGQKPIDFDRFCADNKRVFLKEPTR
jgi:uncharacterized protein YbjT (DUF2867 family)